MLTIYCIIKRVNVYFYDLDQKSRLLKWANYGDQKSDHAQKICVSFKIMNIKKISYIWG